jgi:uncharacterized membrane protein
MIRFLAKIFRGFHFVLGISAPPPGGNERAFVLAWLGILACIVAFCSVLFYVIPHLYFRR